MPEPRCKTCNYFESQFLTNNGYGECMDESKLIYSCYGVRVFDRPEINENNICSNHESDEE